MGRCLSKKRSTLSGQHHRSGAQRGQSALLVSALVLLVETGRNATKANQHDVARGRRSRSVHASVLQSASTEEPGLQMRTLEKGQGRAWQGRAALGRSPCFSPGWGLHVLRRAVGFSQRPGPLAPAAVCGTESAMLEGSDTNGAMGFL